MAMANSGIPLSEWSGSGATKELHETIKLQIEATNRQSRAVWRLTLFVAVLAVIQTVATVVQIIPILKDIRNPSQPIATQSPIGAVPISQKEMTGVPNIEAKNSDKQNLISYSSGPTKEGR